MLELYCLDGGALSTGLAVFLLAMLPAVELKGALPLGVALGLTPATAFFYSYVGSLAPALPIIFLFEPVVTAIMLSYRWHAFGRWLHRHSLRRGHRLQRWRLLGLFLFVALPLPGTGVWTGAAAGALLGLPKGPALLAIAAGNLVAGLMVMLLTWQLV